MAYLAGLRAKMAQWFSGNTWAAMSQPLEQSMHPAYRLTWARTVYGEARGEPVEGQKAVAHVIWNRAKISGRTVAEECLRSFQFSCWNKNDPNRKKLLALQADDLAAFFPLLDAVMAGEPDPTQGATFYHTHAMAEWPAWSHGHQPCAWIGHHVFYKGIKPY